MKVRDDLRKKMNEAVERWSDFLNMDQCIEEMISEIDKQKDTNRGEKIKGFAFRHNKETKAIWVTIMVNGEERPKFQQSVSFGKCTSKVFQEICEAWNETGKVALIPEDDDITRTYIAEITE